MRLLSCLCLGALALAFSTPSFAGTVSYAEGRGSWTPARCTAPTPPSALAKDPETAANSLNEQITLHNQFVAAAQDYMSCISQEAQVDAQGASQVVTQQAQALIQQTQAEVASSSARLSRKSH